MVEYCLVTTISFPIFPGKRICQKVVGSCLVSWVWQRKNSNILVSNVFQFLGIFLSQSGSGAASASGSSSGATNSPRTSVSTYKLVGNKVEQTE